MAAAVRPEGGGGDYGPNSGGYDQLGYGTLLYTLDSLDPAGPAVAPEAGLLIYPNPAQTNARLQLGAFFSNGATIVVYDMGGRLLYKDRTNADFYDLPMQFLAKAVYIVRVTSGHSTITARLVKE